MSLSFFDPPPATKWNVLSLGAGVQSSALALMASKGVIGPMPDFAIFADTQAEPESVYKWLDWLEPQLAFPVIRVTKGNLTNDSLIVKEKDGGTKTMRKLIPLFGIKANGDKTAAIGRRCTVDYKVRPVIAEMRKRCGITHGQKEVTVTQWMGISYDELQRMKPSPERWNQHRWPLIESRMTRTHCKEWLKANGFPEPPRSACYYCPFHDNTEWRRMKLEDPVHFQKAVDFDIKIRELYKLEQTTLKMEVYLHSSCKPLAEIDLDSDEDKGQQVWDFSADCEGLCGI